MVTEAAAPAATKAEPEQQVVWPTALKISDTAAQGGSDQCGSRFAAFAAGCLGSATPAKAGDKLGLMGSVSEEELVYTLRHLETLSRQRAAKLAGVAVGDNASVPGGATCSAPFEKALLESLSVVGEEGTELSSQLFRLLPHDQSGRADLLHVFGMAPVSPQSDQSIDLPLQDADAEAKQSDAGFSFCAEYVEVAADLPAADWALRLSAERHLVELEDAAECNGSWEAATAAINAIRASLAHSANAGVVDTDDTIAQDESSRVSEEAILIAIARCCGSRRPALAKGALRALLELAEARPGLSHFSSAAWKGASEAALGGCLSALRTTKTAGKFAEAAVAAVAQRVSDDASPAVAAASLLGCITAATRAKPPQAPVVAAGLRALLFLVPRLSDSGCLDDTTAICEEVLKARALSAAYSEARAMQRELKKLLEGGGSGGYPANCGS